MSFGSIVLGVTIDDSLQFLSGMPEHLTRRGWNVHVVSDGGPRLERLRGTPGIEVHQIAMSRKPSPVGDLRALREWVTLLRRVKPNVVWVGTPKAGMLAALAARLVGVPVRSYLLRGLRLETSRGLSRIILVAAERLTIAMATDVLAVSRSLQDAAVALRVAPRPRIRILGGGSSNGVDVERFDPTRLAPDEIRGLRDRFQLADDRLVVGFVGRLTRDKGLFVLADALELLERRGVAVQALIVGSVDDATGSAAVDRLRETRCPVAIAGYLDDTASAFALMDVLCIPSYREGFVNVALEASAMGVPIVGSRATGVIDAVRDGQTGLLSDVGDAVGLADNIEQLARDPELRATLGSNGYELVRSEFERKEVQARYAEHLEALVAATGKGAGRRGVGEHDTRSDHDRSRG